MTYRQQPTEQAADSELEMVTYRWSFTCSDLHIVTHGFWLADAAQRCVE